jgi:hypothetical protein
MTLTINKLLLSAKLISKLLLRLLSILILGIQTSSLSTDSNRSSICTGDDMNSFPTSLFRGPFISHAKAITDCTPCPYYKDALAFKVFYFYEH